MIDRGQSGPDRVDRTKHSLVKWWQNTEISKEAWKQTVDKHVSAYWVDKIKLEAIEKSSLKFLNTQNYKIGEVHYLWKMQALILWQLRKQASKQNL